MISAARSAGCWAGLSALLSGRRRLRFHLGQALQHAVAGGAVGEDFLDLRDDILRGEVVLHQLGDDFLPGDQVDHGEARDFDSRLAQQVGERRDAVDHHERRAHHGGFDRGGAAGDDSGARVPERGQGFGDEGDVVSAYQT